MDRFHGTESVVFDRKTFNHFQHETYGISYEGSAVLYQLRCLLMPFQFDVVHIHSLDRLLPLMRVLHPKKPIVLHYHGTKIRGKWGSRKDKWKHANRIIVSTDDLLEGAPDGVEYIPNMVDMDKIPKVESKIHKAFFCNVESGWANDLAMDLAKKYGLELDIHERDTDPLPHEEFLLKMANYEYVIDVRRNSEDKEKVLQSLGLSSLEALASGSKVIDWNGNLIEDFPEEHSPRHVAKRIYDIYQEIM